ncbi:hypothetical protein PV328_007954 [Microctonus aethiopoides]|uniref:Carboxylic ester hydrolase n=1 Tax=Microctonus aethiopoides TaxID=144406 RepID=A0AA39C9S7_9HYME|nr:hypothetical protein PV328_007954 [Microctonus aethiopoides]
MNILLSLIIFANVIYVNSLDDPIVKTPLGKISGYIRKSFKGREYQVFEGVPYAQVPIGALRFQPPEPVTPWQGTISATRPQSNCLQYNHLPQNPPERVEGSEDCLYLNIYKPLKKEMKKLLPVIFYIHGGAFQFGTAFHIGVHYIMDRDLLVVTINYRLGPFGFLSTGDSVVPGNMGLKDQNMALVWVSKYIQHFGGDPNKITLAGLSAGGASVHYHYLSPLSRGLFHGGMSFSGTALDCWTQTENAAEKAKKLGEIVGCPTSDNILLVKCLTTRPAISIAQAVGNFMPWLYNPYTPFGPVVEKESKKPFIDRSPVEIISSGDAADVPWLTSLTSEEGLYPAAEFVNNPQLMNELDANWDEIAPHLLDFNYTIAPNRHVEVAEKIRKHYLGKKKINRSHATQLIHLIGDRLFTIDGEKAARMMANTKRAPVWFYYFTYRGPYSLSDAFIPSHEHFGVSHGDDVFLVLREMNADIVTDKSALNIQNKLMDIWESMAINGTPNFGIHWNNVDPSKEALEYLHIAGVDKIYMDENKNLGEKKFWAEINFNENKLESESCSSSSASVDVPKTEL